MIEVKQVHRALAETGDATRRSVLARFRSYGGLLDRWARSDWRAMADALSRAEDELELAHRTVGREALHALRRRIEDELEPRSRRRTPSTEAA
jgi:hypothetical protein